jgi:acrylyl-CoA reductase (NADPH)
VRAIVVTRPHDAEEVVSLEENFDEHDLMPGDITIDVDFSSLNFKDALALSGRPGVVRAKRLIAGIDLVGIVTESDAPAFAKGDRVLVNGCGLGETHHGGLASRARVKSEWLVPVPAVFTQSQAAAIGTAGFTAMLAVKALERAGAGGEILVTGAAGGLGSIAVMLLSRLGFRVVASTGRSSEHDRLRQLGASAVIDRATLSEAGKPLQTQRWGGAIDSVGGATLANVSAQLAYGATVAVCGNAQSAEVPLSVYPLILRGVSLVGINSVETPRADRLDAWARLARDIDRDLLDSFTSTIGLADAPAEAERMLAGDGRGRVVVDVRH